MLRKDDLNKTSQLYLISTKLNHAVSNIRSLEQNRRGIKEGLKQLGNYNRIMRNERQSLLGKLDHSEDIADKLRVYLRSYFFKKSLIYRLSIF
jgi:hypothetical protein